jgi:multidrug resistance efflux pump
MTDIVERLRKPIVRGFTHPTDDLHREAANEIEQLRAKLEYAVTGYKEAADEIERLRAALEIIAGRRQCLDNLMGNVDVARAALDGKP